ncbi:gfo/Idh/MocA family oxidoreductase [Opitutaceae bacterium EW11]|nr:gfo/Idh/MocA family oxidoreductase [Opitutaceae bacterium EW11]
MTHPSAATRKIRWGVLGFARIAREHVMPAIQRADNAVLSAVATRDGSKLSEVRARFPGVRVVIGYDDLLQDPEIDAVYVPLPNSLHRDWTIRAASQGKHVLCEKPIASTADEAADMVAACRKQGVKLMEAFMYRYTHRTRLVLEVLKSGALGEIKFVQSSFRFLLSRPESIKLRPELGGGSLYDVGCYPINFIGMVADVAAGAQPGGAKPDSFSAECLRQGGVDTIFSAVLRFPSGMLASANCGFNAHQRVFSEIVGTKGVLEIPDTFHNEPGVLTLTTGTARKEIPVPESDRYAAEIQDFSAAILENRDPKFPLAETLRNAEVIDRLLAAAG